MAMEKPRSASFPRTLRTMCAVAALSFMVASEYCVALSWHEPPGLLCPVATDDSVIVGYGEYSADTIAAYDGNTGSLLWQIHSPDTVFVGEMKVCGHLLYAPTYLQEVYVLDVRDGQLIQYLPRQSEGSVITWIACMPGYVFIADSNNRTGAVVAVDTADFEVVWRRSFPRPFLVCEIRPSGSTVELLLGEFDAKAWTSGYRPYSVSSYPWSNFVEVSNYVEVKLRTEDGRILSRKPTARPAHYDTIPATLAPAIRTLLTQLLGGYTPYIPRTPAPSPEDMREYMEQLRREDLSLAAHLHSAVRKIAIPWALSGRELS